MALKLTCPACAAAFALAENVRGKEAFCPSCGASLIVTSAGVAKSNEQPGAGRANPAPARGWNPLWLLLAVPLLLLLICGGLTVYLLTRGHPGKENELNVSPVLGTLTVKPIKTLGPLAYGISPLAFSPDDKTLAAGGWSGPTVTSPWMPYAGSGLEQHPEFWQLGPDDNNQGAGLGGSAAGHWSGEVKLWDVAGWRHGDRRPENPGQAPVTLAFGPEGKTLVIASDGADSNDLKKCCYYTTSEAVVWDFAGNKVVKTIKDASLGFLPEAEPGR